MSKASEEAKESRLWQPVTVKWFAVLCGVALSYAILRYHVVQGVEWSHFPLFILNKAVSLAAVLFVACSYLVGRVLRWHNHDARVRLIVVKFCGLMGLSFAAIHAFMSLALWSASYYPAYFLESGKLNLWGELALTLGVVGLWVLAIPGITTLPTMAKSLGGFRWKRSQRAGYVALTLVAAHLAALGFRGWIDPSRWPAGLPPISLLAFLVAAFAVLVKVRSRIEDD